MRPASVHDVLARCDALRRPDRFVQILDACEADKSSRRAVDLPESAGEAFTARIDAMNALAVMQSVDAGAIAKRLTDEGKPMRIAEEVREARIDAIRKSREKL
jgi:tRNA nucleotidyltransferase (CCA-adding enzyme)